MSIAKISQQGVSLVESMIALLVLSIGLLGIAALQITAMKQNTSSLNHSQAVWIAYNMSDRIRANMTQFDQYKGVDTNTGYSQDCMGATCSNAQMLIADAEDWTTLVQALPGGRGMVVGPVAAPNEVNVTVMWDDDGTGAAGTACGNDPDVDLTCYMLVVAR